MGVMKSRVRTPRRLSSIIQSAASSPDAHVEIIRSSRTEGMSRSIFSRSAGPILAAHPLVLESSVNRIDRGPPFFYNNNKNYNKLT